MEEYLGIIKLFAGNFAPRNFMFCRGQILAISTNTALFSILGTIYGGDGQTTFALPNFGGRVAVGTGQSGGTSAYEIGQIGGLESTALSINNLPVHNHTATATSTLYAEGKAADDTFPASNLLAIASSNIYTAPTGSTNQPMSNEAVTTTVNVNPAGGSQPFSVVSPYLAMNYIICVEGLYPPRD